MKDSGVEWIGEIPEGWKIVKFKNLFSFGRGLPITKADLLESGLSVINYGQIHSKQNDGVNLTDNLIRFVSPLFLESDASSLLNNGDFVFADTSEDVEGIGNAILVKHDKPIFAGYHTVICRPKFSGINRYFAYLFTTDLWRDQLRQLASGIKVFSITQTILNKVLLLIPPKEIQQKISTYLDHKCAQIDAILASILQSIEKLKEYRQAVITRAVTKGLDPDAMMKDSGVKWIGEIPVGWSVTSLRRITSKVDTGSTPAGADEIFFSDSGIPWYTPGDFGENEILQVANKYLSVLGENEVKIFPENSVLLVGIGATMGKVALSKATCSANQQINIINCSEILEPMFLVFFIKSITEYLFKCGKFATLPIINQSETKNILIPLPPIMEQREIINFINNKCAHIDALIAEKQKLHGKITAYKKSLIYEYVTGKHEVRDGWTK